MRNKRARYLRNKSTDADKYQNEKKYLKQTYHHVSTGRDRNGDKTFAQVTDPIRLDECERLAYKRNKSDYKANYKR